MKGRSQGWDLRQQVEKRRKDYCKYNVIQPLGCKVVFNKLSN